MCYGSLFNKKGIKTGPEKKYKKQQLPKRKKNLAKFLRLANCRKRFNNFIIKVQHNKPSKEKVFSYLKKLNKDCSYDLFKHGQNSKR